MTLMWLSQERLAHLVALAHQNIDTIADRLDGYLVGRGGVEYVPEVKPQRSDTIEPAEMAAFLRECGYDTAPPDPTDADIRAWATRQGVEINGRIPERVRDAYGTYRSRQNFDGSLLDPIPPKGVRPLHRQPREVPAPGPVRIAAPMDVADAMDEYAVARKSVLEQIESALLEATWKDPDECIARALELLHRLRKRAA